MRVWSLLRVVAPLGLLAVLVAAGVRSVVEVFCVAGTSMSPTLEDGQYLLVVKLGFERTRPLDRGDLIVFQDRHGFGHSCVKRVIGLPQDDVEVTAGHVHVNGRSLTEDYIRSAGRDGWGPATVPAGHYFVLGDNRNASYDSASWGCLPAGRIIGRVWLSGAHSLAPAAST